jgi:hypothetical protein
MKGKIILMPLKRYKSIRNGPSDEETGTILHYEMLRNPPKTTRIKIKDLR